MTNSTQRVVTEDNRGNPPKRSILTGRAMTNRDQKRLQNVSNDEDDAPTAPPIQIKVCQGRNKSDEKKIEDMEEACAKMKLIDKRQLCGDTNSDDDGSFVLQTLTTIDPMMGHYRDKRLKRCRPSVIGSENSPNEGPRDAVELELRDIEKRVETISTEEYEESYQNVDPTKVLAYKHYNGWCQSIKYFILTMAIIAIGFLTDLDQISLYYYFFVLQSYKSPNPLIFLLSIFSMLSYHLVWITLAGIVGRCCGCHRYNEDDDKYDLIDFQTQPPCYAWHIGDASEDYKSQQDHDESPSAKRHRLNNLMNFKWWMLFPGARVMVILLSFGNPDSIFPYKKVDQFQQEKNQTYRSMAIIGMLNLVTATLPCTAIGLLSDPWNDMSSALFVGAGLCSMIVSLVTMNYGVIDQLVNTIDLMDTALADYRAQQAIMTNIIGYASRHFDANMKVMCGLCFVLAELYELPGFGENAKIDSEFENDPETGEYTMRIEFAHAVQRISEFGNLLKRHVCEDQHHLDVCNEIRKDFRILELCHNKRLTKSTFSLLHTLHGITTNWLLKYASHVKLATDYADGFNLHMFEDIEKLLELKEKREKEVLDNVIQTFDSFGTAMKERRNLNNIFNSHE